MLPAASNCACPPFCCRATPLRRGCMPRTQTTTSCQLVAGGQGWGPPSKGMQAGGRGSGWLARSFLLLPAQAPMGDACEPAAKCIEVCVCRLLCRVLRWKAPEGAAFFQNAPLRVDSGVVQGDLVRCCCCRHRHRRCRRCCWCLLLRPASCCGAPACLAASLPAYTRQGNNPRAATRKYSSCPTPFCCHVSALACRWV